MKKRKPLENVEFPRVFNNSCHKLATWVPGSGMKDKRRKSIDIFGCNN